MRIFIAWLMLMYAGVALAQQPEVYEGVVDGVEDSYRQLVIDDGVFPFALNAKIFDKKGREVNRYALKPGMRVRYEYQVGADGYNQLVAIWILSN